MSRISLGLVGLWRQWTSSSKTGSNASSLAFDTQRTLTNDLASTSSTSGHANVAWQAMGRRWGSTITPFNPNRGSKSQETPRWVPPVKPSPAGGIVDAMKKYTPVFSKNNVHRQIVSREGLHKGRPFMPLTMGLKKTGGRNNQGKVTVRGRGGGHRRLWRQVDFHRGPETWGKQATVIRLEYDPNRSGRIALVQYDDPTVGYEGFSYILSPKGLKPGDKVMSGPQAEPSLGNAVPLGRIPLGADVHNVELRPGAGAILVRSAGCSGQVTGRSEDERYTFVRFPSGEVRKINSHCQAVIGQVSNPLHKLRILGKAGAARWLGRRPKVRGVAMSPPDHPHAGGRKGSPAMPSRSRTGVLAKGGFRTRRYNRNRLSWIMVSRHEARKKVRGY